MDYKIVKELATLSQTKQLQKKLTVMKWGNHKPKLDIRTWIRSSDGIQSPGKGVTLSLEEAEKLIDPIKDYCRKAADAGLTIKDQKNNKK